jgi:drug/metabolite transporter (DMT)-like permease
VTDRRQDTSLLLTAVALMIGATICLGLLDAVAKALGTRFPVTQLVWVRMAVHLAVAVTVFYPSRGWSMFRTSSWRTQLGRSALLMTTGILFFLSLRFLPLAETAAITFSSPLLTVLLAGPLLHERVTADRVGIALLGFAGVLAIIQPFGADISPAVVLPLSAAVTASLYAILTRQMRGGEDVATTWFYTAVVGTAFMPVTAPFGWSWPGPQDLVLLVMLGIFGAIGHLAIINAYRVAQASFVAPLGYLELLWATLLGFLLFAEFPNVLALLGMVTIALSGVMIAGRSRRLRAPIDSH